METDSGHGVRLANERRRLSKRQEFHAGKFYVVSFEELGLELNSNRQIRPNLRFVVYYVG